VIIGSPEPGTVYTKTVTQFTTSGTVSTTVTNYPTATQGTATVVAVVPAASQDACGNQGTQWAFWNNTQGTNSLNGYTQFDPTVYKTQTPFYNATTGAAGGINQGTTSALISIYGSPKFFNSTFFTVGQKVSLHHPNGTLLRDFPYHHYTRLITIPTAPARGENLFHSCTRPSTVSTALSPNYLCRDNTLHLTDIFDRDTSTRKRLAAIISR